METRTASAIQATLDWEHVARDVLRSRLLDDLEESELAPAGEVPYQFSARGHELIQVLLAHHLGHPHDAATVYYRSRPFVLAVGLTLTEALAAGMGREGSPSTGRDVGVVFSLPPRRGVTVLPASGDVGAQYTPAAGWAQACLYRRDVMREADWDGAVAVALGGEASVATNGFWSAPAPALLHRRQRIRTFGSQPPANPRRRHSRKPGFVLRAARPVRLGK